MTKGSKSTSRNPRTTTSGRTTITFGTRTPAPVSVITTDKLADAPLAPEEFRKRLRRLQDLQRAAGEAVLTFAVEYAALYDEVTRQSARIAALHDALKLTDRAATRLRTIAASASAFTPVQDRIPLALDVLYEVILARKEDPTLVEAAIHAGKITPQSTLREIRDFRRVTQANACDELDALRLIAHPATAQQQRRRDLESLNREPRAAR